MNEKLQDVLEEYKVKFAIAIRLLNKFNKEGLEVSEFEFQREIRLP